MDNDDYYIVETYDIQHYYNHNMNRFGIMVDMGESFIEFEGNNFMTCYVKFEKWLKEQVNKKGN